MNGQSEELELIPPCLFFSFFLFVSSCRGLSSRPWIGADLLNHHALLKQTRLRRGTAHPSKAASIVHHGDGFGQSMNEEAEVDVEIYGWV